MAKRFLHEDDKTELQNEIAGARQIAENASTTVQEVSVVAQQAAETAEEAAENALNAYSPTNKPSAEELGVSPADHTHTAADVHALPDTTKQIDIGARPNANLLHNWYFGNPVNRNGKTEYNLSSGTMFTIDRWSLRNGSSKLVVDENEISITTTSTSYNAYFEQTVDVDIQSDDVTVSMLVDDVVGTAYYQCVYKDNTTSSANRITSGMNQALVSNGKEIDRVLIQTNIGASVKLVAIKLELGDTQTLAHQDENGNWVLNEIPDYAEQMAICAQYDALTGEYIGAPTVKSGAAALTAGTSALGNGHIYLQYE